MVILAFLACFWMAAFSLDVSFAVILLPLKKLGKREEE